MKPIAYRVHYQCTFKDYAQRSKARGFILILKAQGVDAYMQPIFKA